MKHLALFLTVLLLFISCSKEKTEEESQPTQSPYLRVSPETIYIHDKPSGGSTKLSVYSNTSWRVGYVNSSSGQYGSLHITSVSPTRGSNNQTVTINFSAIPSGYGGASNTIKLTFYNPDIHGDSTTEVKIYSYKY